MSVLAVRGRDNGITKSIQEIHWVGGWPPTTSYMGHHHATTGVAALSTAAAASASVPLRPLPPGRITNNELHLDSDWLPIRLGTSSAARPRLFPSATIHFPVDLISIRVQIYRNGRCFGQVNYHCEAERNSRWNKMSRDDFPVLLLLHWLVPSSSAPVVGY